MLKDVIVALATFVTAAGGLELFKYLMNRKSNSKKMSAEADKEVIQTHSTAFDNIVKINEFLSKELDEQTEQVRKMQDEILKLTKAKAELEMKEFKYHCEVRGCENRQPPNGY